MRQRHDTRVAAEADSSEKAVLVCDVDLDALHAARSAGPIGDHPTLTTEVVPEGD